MTEQPQHRCTAPCPRCGGPEASSPERVAECGFCKGAGEVANAACWITH